MKELRLSPDFVLPPKALDYPFALLGVTGSGKSNTGAVIVESLYDAGLPFVVVDPTSTWWGIRSGGDGRARGLEVPIFGRPAGKHSDLPLERGAGEFLADLVVDRRLSCVLDFFHLGDAESDADKFRFLAAFGRRLYQRNVKRLYLLLEEADDYAPQSPRGEAAQCLHVWKTIVRRGRAKGLIPISLTQRSAAINKDVLTQTQTLIVMRTTAPQDLTAIEGWLREQAQAKEVLSTLPRLPDGDAWVLSRFLESPTRVHVRRRRTYDSAATPGLDENARPAARLADIDVDVLRSRMAEAIERAKAEDPRELRRRIAELERELRKVQPDKKAGSPIPAPTKTREVPILKDAQVRSLETLTGRLEKAAVGVQAAAAVVDAQAREIKAALAAARDNQQKGAGVVPGRSTGAPAAPAPSAVRAPRVNAEGNGDGRLTGPEQRILDALAWLEALGQGKPEQAAVAFLAGYTVGGGAFNNPRGALRTRGLISYPGADRLALTDAGRAQARPPEFPLTPDEIQTRVLQRLPGPEQKLLRALIAEYPESLSNEELARRAGYTPDGGAFNNPRGRLRTLGLAEYPDRGRVRARPVLFLEGA